MNAHDEFVYSNDLCSAFITAIVESFAGYHSTKWLGRTAVQKLTYFAKVLGVPIPCSFGIYTYGPYSDSVSFTVESLLADEVIIDQSRKPEEYSSYRPGPNSAQLLRLFDPHVQQHRSTIDRVVKALGGFKPSDLELIATLHFIAQKHEKLFGPKPAKADVIHEFKLIKEDKFSDQEIQSWYDALVKAGLI
jgi:uncharacterized protein